MNIENLKKAGIDYEAGLKRCLGKPDFYERILRAFVEEDLYTRTKSAFENNDIKSLKLYVHQAVGSTASISLLTVNKPASQLNALLHNENFSHDELTSIFSIFEAALSLANKEIAKALND